jgi:hypothetical protein
MRNTSLHIKGINRNIGSPDNDTGFCSELINLKDSNGVKVVIDKAVESANIPFTRIRLHRINKTVNHIGVQDDATGVKVVHFDQRSGDILHTFDTFSAGSDIHYTTLNNQIVISDKTAIKEYVYQFNGYKYEFVSDGLQLPISSTFDTEFTNKQYVLNVYADSEEEYIASLQSHVNKFKIENKELCEGIFMYAFTVTLNDGTETGMFNLTPVTTEYTESPSKAGSFIQNKSKYIGAYKNPIETRFKFNNFYQKVTVNVEPIAEEIRDKYDKQISNVNLYVSRPITRMPFNEDVKLIVRNSNWDENWIESDIGFNSVMTYESNIESQLLYRQKTWPFKEFCNGVIYTLEFGGDKQTTGATMEVSQSSIERAGKMFTYNNRIHFYDTNVRLIPQFCHLCNPTSPNAVNADAYVYLHTENKDNILLFSDIKIDTIPDAVFPDKKVINFPEMVVFPDSRAYKMAFIINDASVVGATSRAFVINMSPSPAYNYAYYFSENGTTMVDESVILQAEIGDTYSETNAINVTASGQPIIFPIELSYRFAGNITGLSVMTDDISNAQVGQYPLSVFTDNGVYALAQGDGAVLYSNIIPVTGDTCLNESIIPTKNGVVYIANDALYLLRGKNAQKMSLLLEGEPDTYIQNNDSFLKCCSNSFYNALPFLSVVDFRDYIKDATLSWVANTNELIVSNKAYTYSYVYDFIGNSWYKVTGTFEGIEDNLVLRPVEQTTINAAPSTGKITIPIIHKEKTKTFDSICSADLTSLSSCGAGHTIALVIDGTQVASASFSQITQMPMILSVLCEKIGYLEDYDGTVYATADLSAKSIVVHNITTNSQMAAASFVASSQSVTIPDKAIGARVQVTIGGYIFNALFGEEDSVITILNEIADKINATDDCPVSAQVVRNTINLTSKETGQSTNDINVSVSSTDNDYLYINATPMTGGRDISLEPSQYRQIVDWAANNNGKDTMIHLHTRPFHLEAKNNYKTLKSIALNCLASLSGIHNLSLYTFASNDLINWKCISAAQRQNCNTATIFANRANKAYKYFIFMIGGVVPSSTQISNIILSVEDVANNKPR